MADTNYPALLLQIPDPPPFLYVYGFLDKSINNIAVVGSRSATEYGIAIAKRLCRDMAMRKMTVVSGMTRGIDTKAHEGALEGNGKTIAVLGSGLGKIYPRENTKLFHKIAQNGAVISEFNMTAEPESYNFPARNRIISGISLGTVVVEAGSKSGSLITARLALEQNREVFAVPGSVRSFKSAGTHKLIKQGAKLVENVQNIIEELRVESYVYYYSGNAVPNNSESKLQELSSDESAVFDVLSSYPVHIDDIVRKLSFDSGKLSGILLSLELKGVVNKIPGNFIQKS